MVHVCPSLPFPQSCCDAGMQALHGCSAKAEDAVKELLCLLQSSACLPSLNLSDSKEVAKLKRGEQAVRTEWRELGWVHHVTFHGWARNQTSGTGVQVEQRIIVLHMICKLIQN